MKDHITAVTTGLFVEIGKVVQHMEAQAKRIAELEAQLEEAETLISQTSHGAAERISAMEAQLAEQAPVREVPDTLVSSLVRALQDCLDYGSMTGSEWVSDNAREAIKQAAPVQQEGE